MGRLRTLILTVAAVALLLAVSSARASEPPMAFTHLSAQQGLSQMTVNDMLQDAQGFVWLATQNGLNRYDGNQVKRYYRERNKTDGLASDYINALDMDRDGNLWLATEGGGLAVLNRRTDTFKSYRHKPGDARSLSSDIVSDVLVDRQGRVWAATQGGLDRLDPATGEVTHFVHDAARPESLSSNQSLFALLQDRDGSIWVSTSVGLDRHLGDGKGFQHFRLPASASGSHQILNLMQDSHGDLWLGGFDSGLQRLDPAAGRFTSYFHRKDSPGSLSSNDVRAVFEDSAGRLWIGTAKGLDLFDRRSGAFQTYVHDRSNPRSLADSFVASIMQDRSGLLWVGTQSGGASRWNPRSWSLGHRRPEWLAANPSMVNAFADAPNGGLWLGTMGSGIVHVEAGSGRVLPAPKGHALADPRVMSLLNDSQGQLWVGTMAGGLTRLGADGSRKTFRAGAGGSGGLGADGIMSLYEDRSGRVWIGTFEGGVSVYDPKSGALRRVTDTTGQSAWFERVRATAIREDRQGRIWVATDGDGVLVLDAGGSLLHRFRHDPSELGSLATNSVYALHVDAAGRLWIGTNGGGLDHVVDMSADLPAMRFDNVSQADGLANDVIYGVQADNAGMLWLSSSNGLMRFDPRTKEIRTFHASHGAQGSEFTAGASFRSANGHLLFAGTEGYNDFDPQRLLGSDAPPPVVLTRIEVQHRPLQSGVSAPWLDKLELGHQENALALEFAALDFTDPARNRYAYQLQGFDGDWVTLGTERSASYTNLPAGDYVFRVRAASADSVWNDDGLRLAITVRPAPWRTGWAYAIYAGLALLLLVAAHRLQTQRLRKEQRYARELAGDVEVQTKALIQRNAELAEASAAKSNFLARMSHEIRTPVHGVMGLTELLSLTDLTAQQRHYTETVSRSSQALLQIINDILDVSKIEAGKVELEARPFDLERLVDDCIAMVAPQGHNKDVELVVEMDPMLPRLFIGDALRVRQVLTNLLGNALKFTAVGEVLVRVASKQLEAGRALVRLEVTDTGIGMDPAVLARVFDPFSQADESTTRRFGGTGLGLAICKQLLDLMGGTIGVTSQPNVGSTFWCEIPLTVGDETPLAEAQSPLVGLRIVVATPARSLQEAISPWLIAEGAGRVSVDSSPDFEQLRVRQTDYDVLVLDADRLALSGSPLASLPPIEDLRVVRVALSRQPGLLDGGGGGRQRDVWLAKPLSLRRLRQAIREALAKASPDPAPGPLASVTGHGDAAVRPARVLVVEDNPVNQLVAKGMLTRLGYEVSLAADGGSALVRLSTEHFDAVLMDCQMPGMDGYEATRGLRAASQGKPRVPVIGLTAHASAEARVACVEAGMDDFMSKPYKLDELRAMLTRWTRRAEPV